MGEVLILRLEALEGRDDLDPKSGDRLMEFHVSRRAREELELESSLFKSTGNLILPDFRAARVMAARINERIDATLFPEWSVKAGRLNAMALIDEILHDVARLYRDQVRVDSFAGAVAVLEKGLGKKELDALLLDFLRDFPPLAVYRGETSPARWLADSARGMGTGNGVKNPDNRELAVEELILLRLANENPAFTPFRFLFDDGLPDPDAVNAPGAARVLRPSVVPRAARGLGDRPAYLKAMAILETYFKGLPSFGPDREDLLSLLRAPRRAAPYSLPGQLDYIRRHWGLLLGDKLLRLLGGLDLMREEEKPFFPGPGPTRAYVYAGMEKEYERFSPDRDWMPNVVMMAKSVLVWLHQLSQSYGRPIRRLDEIPEEELDRLAVQGFNALWLIGVWERSRASERIKRLCGNPEAAASAYSLFDYEIAEELGGWPALDSLRARAAARGIRLGADMVPNHTGIDSAWVRERPELFMSRSDCPFPGYSFNGEDLSGDGRVGIWLEDHYYNRSDAAVVFKRLDRSSGEVRYLYHGNDGTGLPWSDTAQIDFLSPAAREAVKERILHVAQSFPIIRFDAAMVLARRHFRRLWYPEPGQGGDVPSRSEYALDHESFDRAMPEEFWREVVDLCAREAPDTLLLAEAFWMMEGYFVRTLGMHRVYNSAFMNMLKREENAKYRETIRNTQKFDKDILKRFVNFMNNPDEETALAQFGSGDKYFGVCTLMATMPGLPMFGHGQIEGFSEKYGMEYRRAYKDERPDPLLLARHEREIFPLLKRRHLFSGVEFFLLYDLVSSGGSVNENVFAYSNGAGSERALVVYNNAYPRAEGWIKESVPFAEKNSEGEKQTVRKSLAETLGLHAEAGHYLVMREQRSGLWFLRRSRDIIEGGLHLLLDGYQCQVFLDLFEAVDDATGLYAALHDELDGAGVPELTEALEDIARKELYALLARLASPRFFKVLRGLAGAARTSLEDVEPARSIPAAGESPASGESDLVSLLETVAEPALALYLALQDLLREEGPEALTEPEGVDVESDSRSESANVDSAAIAVPKEEESPAFLARDRFLAGLARLGTLIASGDSTPEAGALARFRRATKEPGRLELLACYLIVDGVKEIVGKELPGEEARRFVERLALERKLREALRMSGTPGDRAYRGMAMAKILLSKSEPDSIFPAPSRAKPQPVAGEASRALAIFHELENDEELRALLNVHVWNGKTWFNKETFEDFLELGILTSLLAGREPEGSAQGKRRAPAKGEKGRPSLSMEERAQGELERRAPMLAAIRDRLLEAEKASNYQVDAFEAALESSE